MLLLQAVAVSPLSSDNCFLFATIEIINAIKKLLCTLAAQRDD